MIDTKCKCKCKDDSRQCDVCRDEAARDARDEAWRETQERVLDKYYPKDANSVRYPDCARPPADAGRTTKSGVTCKECNEPAARSALDEFSQCDECRVKHGLLPRGVKHGPGGRGEVGPCDPGCLKCAAEQSIVIPVAYPYRPDGFSQLSIDQTKAALLSSAPKMKQ